MTMNQMLDALGRHKWSCVYDKSQKEWCLWRNGRCIFAGTRKDTMYIMRSIIDDINRRG